MPGSGAIGRRSTSHRIARTQVVRGQILAGCPFPRWGSSFRHQNKGDLFCSSGSEDVSASNLWLGYLSSLQRLLSVGNNVLMLAFYSCIVCLLLSSLALSFATQSSMWNSLPVDYWSLICPACLFASPYFELMPHWPSSTPTCLP